MQKAQSDLQKKTEELAIAQKDRVRFKELSEGYMQEVARLEAQLEAADLKPKPKASQRPKDTVKRETSAGNKNPHSAKQKLVEMKQLGDVIPILKLKLQE